MCEVDCLGDPLTTLFFYNLSEDVPFTWSEEIAEVTLPEVEWIRPPCNMPLRRQFARVSSPADCLFAQADSFTSELKSLMQEPCTDE